jgi:hypothetical protein
MEDNNDIKPEDQPQKRIVGKPFEKNDPRINRAGRPAVSADIRKYIRQRLAEKVRQPGTGEDPENVPIRMEAIFNKLLTLAYEGNMKALEILLKYGFGNPTQMVEISGKDGAPLQSVPMVAWVGQGQPEIVETEATDEAQEGPDEHSGPETDEPA